MPDAAGGEQVTGSLNRGRILYLLYAILLFIGSRHLVILLCCSVVILGGALSTYLKEAKGGVEAVATGEQV